MVIFLFAASVDVGEVARRYWYAAFTVRVSSSVSSSVGFSNSL
jgi:hypothetical protein